MDITLTEGVNNLRRVTLGSLSIWFSYETPIAVSREDETPLVAQNIWTTTTARHLNILDGGNKASRVPHQEVLDRIADSISVTSMRF
jgi:hypothetical protein